MTTEILEKPERPKPSATPECPLTLDMEMQASEAGFRVEYIQGIGGIWEMMPLKRHQRHIFQIQTSIKRIADDAGSCSCYHYSDLSMKFPDGSLKRPDIATFCVDPEEEDESVTALPDAVIELVSPGYEAKDYNIAVPFYRRFDIRDIVIFNPADGDVLHITPETETHHTSPVSLTFACGCTCTV